MVGRPAALSWPLRCKRGRTMGNGKSKGKRKDKGHGNGHPGGAAPGGSHLSKLQYLAGFACLQQRLVQTHL